MGESGLGALLRHLRERRSLTLRELGQLADVDHAYVYRLESGEKESPSEDVRARLLRALKTSKREALMLRFLAEHPETNAGLVRVALADETVTYDIFATVAGVAMRGRAEPDYAKMIEVVRRAMDEHDGAR